MKGQEILASASVLQEDGGEDATPLNAPKDSFKQLQDTFTDMNYDYI
jgi:hypothetical protein